MTRNYANGIQGNTKLQRRSALLRTFSNTCRDIHTTVKSKELAYGTCTHWHTSRNQHVNICTHARPGTNNNIDFVFGEEANDLNLIP